MTTLCQIRLEEKTRENTVLSRQLDTTMNDTQRQVEQTKDRSAGKVSTVGLGHTATLPRSHTKLGLCIFSLSVRFTHVLVISYVVQDKMLHCCSMCS